MLVSLTNLISGKKAAADQKSNAAELYDYSVYHMRSQDRLIAFLIGAAAAAIVIHIFFGNFVVDIVAMIAAGVAAQFVYRNIMLNRVKNQLTLQFKDMLDSVNSSVSAGKVAVKAFEDAENDMLLQYGKDSHIYKEIRTINLGVMNGDNLEELLLDFGKRSCIEDIESFANVFSIANRRGGNMKTILNETKSILCDKIEIEQEIKTMVGATKNQLNIMMLMPLVIVPMVSGLSEDASGTLSDIMVKVAALIAFIIAYVIGTKITDIKL